MQVLRTARVVVSVSIMSTCCSQYRLEDVTRGYFAAILRVILTGRLSPPTPATRQDLSSPRLLGPVGISHSPDRADRVTVRTFQPRGGWRDGSDLSTRIGGFCIPITQTSRGGHDRRSPTLAGVKDAATHARPELYPPHEASAEGARVTGVRGVVGHSASVQHAPDGTSGLVVARPQQRRWQWMFSSDETSLALRKSMVSNLEDREGGPCCQSS